MQFTAVIIIHNVVKIENTELTAKANWPNIRFIPIAPWHAGDVVLSHLSVHLKIQVIALTDIAHIVHWLPVPGGGQQGASGRVRRVETLDPDTLVQLLMQSPAGVPVTLHPPLWVLLFCFWVKEFSGRAALISQSGPIASQIQLFLSFSHLSLFYLFSSWNFFNV